MRPRHGRGRVPDFLIIGAGKCGTSALHAYLRAHPDVFMPTEKELAYFHDGWNWRRGEAWYRAHFAPAKPGQICGEASPQYTHACEDPDVAARIYRLVPDARLIYLVRDPFERLVASYYQRVGSARERRPINEAIVADPSYVQNTRYAHQLSQYRPFFPLERIKVVVSERLRRDRKSALREIFAFLGLSSANYDFTHARVEVHRTADLRLPRALGRTVLRRPLLLRASLAVPASVRRRVSRIAWRPMPEQRQRLSSALIEQLRPLFVEEARGLREYLGPDFEGWGLLDDDW